MDIYRGSLTNKHPNGIFSHFGTLLSACHRIESLFAGQSVRLFDGKNYGIYTHKGSFVKTTSPDDLYREFLSFIEKARIRRYHLTFNKCLRLQDCWGDDPIGSGALSIIDPTSIQPALQKELETLFHPFGKNIMHVDVIEELLSPQDIKAIEKSERGNQLFSAEMIKRKERARIRGENWEVIKAYEVVWVHYTLKLRNWAISKGYDFIEYINQGEDEGKTSFITLKANSVGQAVETLRFDTCKLRDIAAPRFSGFSTEEWEKGRALRAVENRPTLMKDLFWCSYHPTDFISPA